MKNILVPTDFNRLATTALQFAVPLARAAGAEITVLYADTFQPPTEFTATQMPQLTAALDTSRNAASAELDRYAHEHVPADLQVRSVVREALPVDAIVEAAADADLVVMGTHGRGPLARLLLGSVAQGVIERVAVPVLTVSHAAGEAKIARILTYAETESTAREIATIAGAEVVVVESDDFTCCESDLIVVPKRERAKAIRHAPAPVLAV